MIVWLASIPRSGNTLLRIILNSVFGRARGPRILSPGSIGSVENRDDCRTAGALLVYSRRGDETICLSAIQVARRGPLTEEKFYGKVIWICGR